jgi:hypothetical protein
VEVGVLLTPEFFEPPEALETPLLVPPLALLVWPPVTEEEPSPEDEHAARKTTAVLRSVCADVGNLMLSPVM